MKPKLISGAILGAIIVTAISAFIAWQALGTTWYGYPLPWLSNKVSAPGYNPWTIHYGRLAIDLVFWFIVIGAVLMVVNHFKTAGEHEKKAVAKAKPTTTRRRRRRRRR